MGIKPMCVPVVQTLVSVSVYRHWFQLAQLTLAFGVAGTPGTPIQPQTAQYPRVIGGKLSRKVSGVGTKAVTADEVPTEELGNAR